MKRIPSFVFALSLSTLGLTTGIAAAAQPPNPRSLPTGTIYRVPAPESTVPLDTHFGVDAKTGKMQAYRGNVHPDEVLNPPKTGEQVLYVAPPISVENRYVPYPGAAPQQPPAAFRRAPQPNQRQQHASAARQQPQFQPQSQVQGQQVQAYQQQQPNERVQQPRHASRQIAPAAPAQQKPASQGKPPWWKGIFKHKKKG